MGGTRDIYNSSQTFLASFECEPIRVYARVDLKKELEPIELVIADFGGKEK